MLDRLEEWLTRYEAGHIDRRGFLAGVAALAAQPARASAQSAGVVQPSGIHHVEIKTRDPRGSLDFYSKLLNARVDKRDDTRTVMQLGTGGGAGYLSIGTGPIPRVDHFSLKVPAMDPRNPKPTLDALLKAGYKARQVDYSIYVTDPSGYEVQLQAPGTPA